MHESVFEIRKAEPSEAPSLSQLAHLAKAFWGYSSEFMEAFDEELSYNVDDLNNERYAFRVGTEDGNIRGFYALDLEAGSDNLVEMIALFVEPTALGRGMGRRLFEHSVERARESGARTMMIHSDPYAEKFYLKMNAKTVGSIPSGSIEGRELPLMEYQL